MYGWLFISVISPICASLTERRLFSSPSERRISLRTKADAFLFSTDSIFIVSFVPFCQSILSSSEVTQFSLATARTRREEKRTMCRSFKVSRIIKPRRRANRLASSQRRRIRTCATHRCETRHADQGDSRDVPNGNSTSSELSWKSRLNFELFSRLKTGVFLMSSFVVSKESPTRCSLRVMDFLVLLQFIYDCAIFNSE